MLTPLTRSGSLYPEPMLPFRRAVLALVCLALTAAQFRATAQPDPKSSETQRSAARFPTNEDLRHLKALSNPQLSPDGKQILFTVTSATADGAASHLWLVPT